MIGVSLLGVEITAAVVWACHAVSGWGCSLGNSLVWEVVVMEGGLFASGLLLKVCHKGIEVDGQCLLG